MNTGIDDRWNEDGWINVHKRDLTVKYEPFLLSFLLAFFCHLLFPLLFCINFHKTNVNVFHFSSFSHPSFSSPLPFPFISRAFPLFSTFQLLWVLSKKILYFSQETCVLDISRAHISFVFVIILSFSREQIYFPLSLYCSHLDFSSLIFSLLFVYIIALSLVSFIYASSAFSFTFFFSVF